MNRHGGFSEKACGGIATRAMAPDSTPCARSVKTHHIRHDPVADRATLRLIALNDRTRTARVRCEIAAAFSREMDAIFTHALRLPRTRLHHLVAGYDRVLHDDLLPRLAAEGITFPRWDELSSLECVQMQRRFHDRTFPLFSPMVVDSTHPLPQLPSLALNIGMQVDGRLVLVTMSPHIPRLLAVRRGRYVTVESFVGALLPHLLVGVRITEHTAFRVTRSALLDKPVRLEVERNTSVRLIDALASRLGVADSDVYPLDSSLAMGGALAIEQSGSAPTRRPSGSARRSAHMETAR